MIRSRVTLARIDGRGDRQAQRVGLDPAIDVGHDGADEVPLPVDHGRVRRARRAPRWRAAAASFCAAAMPSSSHSSWVAHADRPRRAPPATRSNSFSRSASVSILESRTPLTRRSRGSTAAPTMSGPAHAPRPTSSMPTTTSWPAAHSSCSTERVGGRFLRQADRARPANLGRRRPQAPTARQLIARRDAGLAGLDPADHGEAGRRRPRRRLRGRPRPADRPTSAGRSRAPRARPAPR